MNYREAFGLNLPTVCTGFLISGLLLDSLSTLKALFYPPAGGNFVEVGNVLVIVLMYNMRLGFVGFLVGMSIIVAFEVALIWFGVSAYRKYNELAGDVFLTMIILAGVHWAAAIGNLLVIYS